MKSQNHRERGISMRWVSHSLVLFPLRVCVDLHCGALKLNKKGWPRVCVSFHGLGRPKFKFRDTQASKIWGSNILKQRGPQEEVNLTFLGTFPPRGICRFLRCARVEAKKPSRNLQLEAKNEVESSIDHSVKKTKIGVQSLPRIRGLGRHLQTFSWDLQMEIL